MRVRSRPGTTGSASRGLGWVGGSPGTRSQKDPKCCGVTHSTSPSAGDTPVAESGVLLGRRGGSDWRGENPRRRTAAEAPFPTALVPGHARLCKANIVLPSWVCCREDYIKQHKQKRSRKHRAASCREGLILLQDRNYTYLPRNGPPSRGWEHS